MQIHSFLVGSHTMNFSHAITGRGESARLSAPSPDNAQAEPAVVVVKQRGGGAAALVDSRRMGVSE
jgi:hypothetical protein